MAGLKISMKDCMQYFFTHVPDAEGSQPQHKWKCNVCLKTYKQNTTSGYTNLQHHIGTHDPNYEQTYKNLVKKGGQGTITLDSCGFINKKTIDMFEWIMWIVNRNLPFSEIENEHTRRAIKWQHFSVETLMKYVELLTKAVEKEIEKELSTVSSFGLSMDGWSKFNSHFLAIYAVYMVKGEVKNVLLCLAPLLDETVFTADEHIVFIESTLAIYRKQMSDVSYMSGDNCEVNRSIARKTGIPLIGCYSHRLNLAVKKFLKDYEAQVNSVHDVMVELRTLKNAANLRYMHAPTAKLDNDTRWSSVYDMLKRYFQLHEVLQSITIPSVVRKIPSRQQHAELEELITCMQQLNSVTVELQRADVSLLEARVLFDGVMDLFPAMGHHLAEDAKILSNVDFERGILKVCKGEENLLTEPEKHAIRKFKKAEHCAESDMQDSAGLSFAQQLLKRRRIVQGRSMYIDDINHVLPTSNICERLFSQAKHVMTTQRSALLPVNFEMLLFLKINQRLWGIQSVHKVMTQRA